jgi:S1-C subfamily serine protease
MSRWIPAVGVGAAIVGGIIALVIASNHTTTKSVTTTVVQTGAGASEPASFASSGSSGESINQIYRQDAPGVVDIKVKSKSSSGGNSLFGGGSSVEEGEGAGVVYDDKGDIVTDEHVIAGAIKVVVTFQDGKQAAAKVLGSDPSTDVGVIKVDVPSSELHPIKFADSDSAQVGDPVVAIGSPFSQPWTVTSGIVSQTGRAITAPNNFTISGAIQTDAAINPGNSGGPLLNAAGQVLGLNDQIETDSTNSATGEGQNSGIGFATPANADVQVANEIIAGKKVTHAYLGASLVPDDSFSVNATPGAEVASVQPNSPASQAGLEVNDLITKLDATSITGTDQLISDLAHYNPGQTVTLTVQRDGQTKQIKVKLGNRPAEAPTAG